MTDHLTTGTTHDPQGGGGPRLIFALGGEAIPTADGTVAQTEYALSPARTMIGSAANADLRLAGLAQEQASIVRDEFDEYVLVQESKGSRAGSTDSRSAGTRCAPATGSSSARGR